VGQGLYGGYPYAPGSESKKKKRQMFFQEDNFLFFKQLFYKDSLEENFFGETTRWFIEPLEELAGMLGALELETAWVVLGARCGKYQGLVAVTQETFWGNVAVAGMCLSWHALQVFERFVHTTLHSTWLSTRLLDSSSISSYSRQVS